MSESPQNNSADRYKDKLSAGTYAKKQIGDALSSIFSLLIGGTIGNLLGKAFKIGPKLNDTDYGKEANGALGKIYLIPTVVGALLGSMIGGIIKGYSRWKKHERERLEISEINEDVANMKIRHRTDPELLKENALLRETLSAEIAKTEALQKGASNPQSNITRKILNEGSKTPQEHAENNISASAGRAS